MLTERQTRIVALVADGWSDKRIARELCISESTVKNHLIDIRAALGERVTGRDNQRVAVALWWWFEGVRLDRSGANGGGRV